jgi:hypothetical protein
MLNSYIITKTRNMSKGEFPAVRIFENEQERNNHLNRAAEAGKVPVLIVTVRPQGKSYRTFIFSWAALVACAIENPNTGSWRLMVDAAALEAYAKCDGIETGQ